MLCNNGDKTPPIGRYMQHIISEIHHVKSSATAIYSFLADSNHLQVLMPDKVKNWQSDSRTCSFDIEGMAHLQMQLQQQIPYRQIRWESFGKNPFSFVLFVDITSVQSDSSEIYFQLDADMNPMLAMMAKKPLKNLLNHFCVALQQKYN